MSDALHLPVVPLRDLVLFPGVTAPINAGRPATLRALEKALAGDRIVFVVAQRKPGRAVSPELLHTVGTVARIDQVQRGLAGMQLLITGLRRAVAVRYLEAEDHLEATVRDATEQAPVDPEDPGFQDACFARDAIGFRCVRRAEIQDTELDSTTLERSNSKSEQR